MSGKSARALCSFFRCVSLKIFFLLWFYVLKFLLAWHFNRFRFSFEINWRVVASKWKTFSHIIRNTQTHSYTDWVQCCPGQNIANDLTDYWRRFSTINPLVNSWLASKPASMQKHFFTGKFLSNHQECLDEFLIKKNSSWNISIFLN